MSDGSAEVQIAVYSALAALDPELAAGGIWSPAPQDTPMPFVEIGESDTVADDVQCRDGVNETVLIHVWSPPNDRVAPKRIMSRIREALHFADLNITGRPDAQVRVRGTRLFPDADGQSLHGVVTVNVNHHAEGT